MAQEVDCRARAEVRAADAGNHQYLGFRLNLCGSLLNARKLLTVIGLRQIHPAVEIIARTRVLDQFSLRRLCRKLHLPELTLAQK